MLVLALKLSAFLMGVFELGGVRFYVLSTSILTSGRGVSRCEIENGTNLLHPEAVYINRFTISY